jgi:hypothetical protein
VRQFWTPTANGYELSKVCARQCLSLNYIEGFWNVLWWCSYFPSLHLDPKIDDTTIVKKPGPKMVKSHSKLSGQWYLAIVRLTVQALSCVRFYEWTQSS